GSVLCKADGCTRGVKVRGFCWSHGGGKNKNHCQSLSSSTSSRHKSLPRTKSCIYEGCKRKPGFHSFCEIHSHEVTQPGYIFEL
uniref:WRKY19-like zinc finger domain-containing protein n=1 Tax=Globisporangium ultimum (strain ATCC 200006 / CBS 805.95 / DAOM BR144) TaxID=431595 RepID=K3WWH4_GLOUD